MIFYGIRPLQLKYEQNVGFLDPALASLGGNSAACAHSNQSVGLQHAVITRIMRRTESGVSDGKYWFNATSELLDPLALRLR